MYCNQVDLRSWGGVVEEIQLNSFHLFITRLRLEQSVKRRSGDLRVNWWVEEVTSGVQWANQSCTPAPERQGRGQGLWRSEGSRRSPKSRWAKHCCGADGGGRGCHPGQARLWCQRRGPCESALSRGSLAWKIQSAARGWGRIWKTERQKKDWTQKEETGQEKVLWKLKGKCKGKVTAKSRIRCLKNKKLKQFGGQGLQSRD